MYSLFNRKPVERVEKGSDMDRFTRTEDKSRGMVMKSLEFEQEILWTAGKKGVTVVKPGKNESTD